MHMPHAPLKGGIFDLLNVDCTNKYYTIDCSSRPISQEADKCILTDPEKTTRSIL